MHAYHNSHRFIHTSYTHVTDLVSVAALDSQWQWQFHSKSKCKVTFRVHRHSHALGFIVALQDKKPLLHTIRTISHTNS